MMHAAPLKAVDVPYQDCLDGTRPYARVQTLGDKRRSAYLVYRYSDTGELVRVPHMPYNAERETSMGVYGCGNPLPDRTRMHRTVAAWCEYMTSIKPELDAIIQRLSSMDEFNEWEAKRAAAAEDLRKAFYFDTSDVNSRASAYQMSVESICRIAEVAHSRSQAA